MNAEEEPINRRHRISDLNNPEGEDQEEMFNLVQEAIQEENFQAWFQQQATEFSRAIGSRASESVSGAKSKTLQESFRLRHQVKVQAFFGLQAFVATVSAVFLIAKSLFMGVSGLLAWSFFMLVMGLNMGCSGCLYFVQSRRRLDRASLKELKASWKQGIINNLVMILVVLIWFVGGLNIKNGHWEKQKVGEKPFGSSRVWGLFRFGFFGGFELMLIFGVFHGICVVKKSLEFVQEFVIF